MSQILLDTILKEVTSLKKLIDIQTEFLLSRFLKTFHCASQENSILRLYEKYDVTYSPQ